ncbi:hypothetical protein [Lacipirellula limnantheis]|uniref:Stigma-specific protein, Stig1 n=1 Tax=Lacipirellula limnantheis TaxID=2528024 RepID=A0A517TWP4_9BACT|nr:hypothetical protein [Lacipirellula limnantheis]QDT72796.1 hypothetical protein I41_19800 [Lacipirellula limnantheis]
MLMRTRVVASLAALCLAASGCRSAINCTDGCARRQGSPLAGARYDCSCETSCPHCCEDSAACGSPSETTGCADACGNSCNNGCRRGFLDRLCGCTGCGELYWCEWYNSPPQLCQPCDCHGNYVGPGVDRYVLPNASGRSGTPVGTEAPWLEPR